MKKILLLLDIAEERIYADYRLAQAAMNEGQNSTLFSDLREDVGQDELDWDVDLEAEEYSVVGEAHNKKDDSVFLVPATPKKGSRTRPDSPVPFVPRKSRRLASLGPLEADDILLTSRGNNGTSPTASPTRNRRTPKAPQTPRAQTTPKTPRAPRAPRTPKIPARPRKK